MTMKHWCHGIRPSQLPNGHRFQGLIEAMSEAIAETDDELMEKFFGGEPFTTEEICLLYTS